MENIPAMPTGERSHSSFRYDPAANPARSKHNRIEIPSISLPKGGGAIKGIDEKFTVNAANGTATFSLPLPVGAARGVAPSLNIAYDSGAGNGIFGLGWNLTLPSIKRKTDKRLPRYRDEDVFLFAEAEDLVPELLKGPNGKLILNPVGKTTINEKDSPDGLWSLRYYKPRIEGTFARIERWSNKNSGEVKWRVISPGNVTTLFGWSSNSTIADPDDHTRVFEWLPEFTFDDKGNCAHYVYKGEDDSGFDPSLLHNRNRVRNNALTYTNRYLEKVCYGNKTPYKEFGDVYPSPDDYLFSTVFDYGEYNIQSPFDKVKEWDFRNDSFSNYKSGFEIRTTRLCKRVMLFHHFNGPDEYNGLVSSLNFGYDTSSEHDFTFLTSVTEFGYIRKPDGSYSSKSLPPLEFQYQKHDWNKEIRSLDYDETIHAPIGLDEQQYRFTDFFNEGLSGILSEQANGWYYKQNLGNGKFDHARLVTPKPSFDGLGEEFQLVDLDGDGGKQLVSFDGGAKGFFEMDDDEQWTEFKRFHTLPNIDFRDASTRLLDLNGDGRPEAVISHDTVFTWYESEGRNGFKSAQQSAKSFDEEAGPAIAFADSTQTIFLADMCGDGLTDIVRIRNGEICYWPNLGYGKFGAKISLDNAPVFDAPDAFNPSYLRLADIDGSGTSDVVYLGKNKFTCWKNLSGNSIAAVPFEIDPFPNIHSHAEVTMVDLLGNGVACIVWSSALSKDAQASLKYIDLMNGKKPHVLISFKNNLGKETFFEYAASTRFYIEDKLAGRPWITKLHFPVQCLIRTETRDYISGSRFVNAYTYHHGYYDHAEREFRGFGMVEQIDSEYFEHWEKVDATNIVEKALHQEPVVTRTWFHTGAYLGQQKILDQYSSEYWYEEMKREGYVVTHPEAELADASLILCPGLDDGLYYTLTAEEWQEAVRACKGMVLRSEVFARDAQQQGDTPEARRKEYIPYTVTTRNGIIELIQPRGENSHAVFVVKESETITYSYDRNPEDPHVVHNLSLRLDEYGNVLETASIVYPRLKPDASLPAETAHEQAKCVIIMTQNSFTNDVIGESRYRLRLPSETRTFELKGLTRTGIYYTRKDFDAALQTAQEIPYHQHDSNPGPGAVQKRLIEHVRTLYMKDDLSGPLPLYKLESLGIPFENYALAYTPELLYDIYGSKVDPPILSEGKFMRGDGEDDWWIRSGKTQFMLDTETLTDVRNRFYQPVSYTDPYGATTRIRYYGAYSLLISEVEDALGNVSRVERFNFRLLSPERTQDINGNFSETICDELGLVKALALFGKGDEADELTGISEITDDTESALVNDFFSAPDSAQLVSRGKELLQHASARFVYDFEVFRKTGKPGVVTTIVREQHHRDNSNSPVQINFEYSNGLGQSVMKKVQAEPGVAKRAVVNPDYSYTVATVDTAALEPVQLRWIGTGRTVVNNKGSIVKQFESYFSATHAFEDVKELVETGVTSIQYYDALGRAVRTDNPNKSFTKAIHDSWKQAYYDANDTVLESDWYRNRVNRLIDAALIQEGKDPLREKAAAEKAALHADTPNVKHLDTQGRAILHIEHNRNPVNQADEFYHTRLKYDTEGNLRKVTDARGNTLVTYKYDMLGNMVHQASMDTGQRWLFADILGNPLRVWDERYHEFQYTYDIAHRPTQCIVIGGDGPSPLNHVIDRVVYGESELLAGRTNEAALQDRNILGNVVKHYDTGGLVDTPDYDFKGQPLTVTRRMFKRYKEVVDWVDENLVNDLEDDAFTFSAEIDALGRVIEQIAPDGSTITPSYNEAGLLNSETVTLPGSSQATAFIKDIDYNERGQRRRIVYGNDVFTNLYYDRETFLPKRIETKRLNNDLLQDLYYTCDPVGNITHVEDRNIQTTFFNNQKTDGVAEFTYDAIYRLVQATGRENNVALGYSNEDNWNDEPFMQAMNPGDPMAMRPYTQYYSYDAVGNITRMRQVAAGNSWTRDYAYETINNRLKTTSVGSRIYQYPHHAKHGFMTALPHLADVSWNFKEELSKTIRQRRTDGGTPEATYYQYDGQGQRLRKITENQADPDVTPTLKDERIYVAGYELYKSHGGAKQGLERTSLSLMDQGHRFVMIERETEPRFFLGIPIGRTSPKQTVRYQIHNHVGSSALELNESAQVISYEEYHPYGTTAYQAKNSAIDAAAKRYRYTGMERDDETGLEYHSARYYLPWLARWLNADPSGIADGVCVYEYAQSEPISNADVGGRQAGPWGWLVRGRQMEEGVKRIAAPVIESAPVQVTTGVVEGLTDTVVGIGTGMWDRAGRTYNELAEHPEYLLAGPMAVTVALGASEVKHQAKEISEKADAQGGGARGWYVAVNQQLNPAYGIFEHGDKMLDAIDRGDWRAAGNEGTKATVSVVNTVLLVRGAVGSAKSLTTKTPRPSTPASQPRPPAPKPPSKPAPKPAETPAAKPVETPRDVGPYSSNKLRQHLEEKYGRQNVSSTTAPRFDHPSLLKKPVRLRDGRSVGYDARGLPDFSPYAVTSARVPRGNYAGEMRAATRQLREALKRGENVGVSFDAKQMKAIKGGKSKIPGYTWHHVSGGELQLVPDWIHDAVPHIGSGAMRKGR